MKRAIMMDPKDDVATVLNDLVAGDRVTVVSAGQEVVKEVVATKAIPFGHKVALDKIEKGAKVIKYGEVIGVASQDIAPGDHAHIHNVDSNRMLLPKVWYRKER